MDCALAELYTKNLSIERSLQEQKHADVLTKLYMRMNEVSCTLGWAGHSVNKICQKCLVIVAAQLPWLLIVSTPGSAAV